MKKILFLVLLMPSICLGQSFLRLPYSYILHVYQGDTIKQMFRGDTAKLYTDKAAFSFNKPIFVNGVKLGSGGALDSSKLVSKYEMQAGLNLPNHLLYSFTGGYGSQLNMSDAAISFGSISSKGSSANFIARGGDINQANIEFYLRGYQQTANTDYSIEIDTSGMTFKNSGDEVAKIDSSGNIDIKGQYKVNGVPITLSSTVSLQDFNSDISTSGTSETDLYTYTIPANTLVNNGDKLIFNVCLQSNASGSTTSHIKFYIGGTNLGEGGTTLGTTYYSHTFKCTIVKTSSTAFKGIIEGVFNGSFSPTPFCQIIGGTLTYSSTNIFKITGQCATNEIIAKFGNIEFKPAAQ